MTSQDMELMARVLRHRLRNIASGVKVATTLLSGQLASRLTPSEQEYFPLIVKECDALAELASRLSLLLGSVPDGKAGQLGSLVAQACHGLRERRPLLNIRCIPAAGAETATVKSDVCLLTALAEILANAAAASSGQEVVVRYACAADSVEIVVQDQGKGLSPGDWLAALSPFRLARLDRLGIGLAIAARAVAAMGGTLRAQQDADGFCVILNLPLEQQDGQPGECHEELNALTTPADETGKG